MVLGGNVTLRDGVYTKRFEPNVDIFNLRRRRRRAAGGGAPRQRRCPSASTSRSMRRAPYGSTTISRGLSRAPSSRSMGRTTSRCCSGRAEIDHGDILFEGNRYRITRGAIDFRNPSRIEPFFDIQAETTSARSPIRAAPPRARTRSTASRSRFPARSRDGMNFDLNSDPPLPKVDIISLVFGQANATDLGDPELRQLRPHAATQSEEQLIKAGLAAGPGRRHHRDGRPRASSRRSASIRSRSPEPRHLLGRSADPHGPAHHRQAAVEPRLPHLRPRARHDHARPDHRPGVRSSPTASAGS